MSIKPKIMLLPVCVLALVLLGPAPGLSQEKLQESPGGYHGEQDFPINWKRYYSYEEWTGIMHDLQDQYSHLADIRSIGTSRMGREQYLLTITARDTGPHQDKPAMWVDGAIHGNEVNGITCSLYLAWYLLTRYDYDEFVHDLVNSTTFYILPGLNVDANHSYVVHPNTPNNPRETYRPEDNDGDGLYDEDRTEDVDGDGELSYMYVEDPEGPLKLSPDGHLFVEVADDRERVRRFRSLGPEGFDNDGDGLINEDDIGGPDPNRNFPYGWNLDAGNPYPMSEPETRNVFEFQRAHDNIFASFHYHNTGRLIMMQAPPRATEEELTEARGEYGYYYRRRQMSYEDSLAFLRGKNKYAQLFERQVAPKYQHDMDVQTAIVTRGAQILKNYEPVIGGLSGQAHAATYYMLGAYAYLMELWGSPAFADIDEDGRVSTEEYHRWIDLELHGEGWIDPHPVQHPDLGEVWIGGSPTKHIRRTPPSRYVEMEAQKNADFVLFSASEFPEVTFHDIQVTPETGNLYWVDVELENDKLYPTISDREIQLGTAVMDRLIFRSSNNVELLPVPQEETRFDPVNPAASADGVGEARHEFRLRGKEVRTFRYLVEMSGSGGWVEFQVESKFGGNPSERVELRVSN